MLQALGVENRTSTISLKMLVLLRLALTLKMRKCATQFIMRLKTPAGLLWNSYERRTQIDSNYGGNMMKKVKDKRLKIASKG